MTSPDKLISEALEVVPNMCGGNPCSRARRRLILSDRFVVLTFFADVAFFLDLAKGTPPVEQQYLLVIFSTSYL
jgi:hypothetical protein